MFSISKQRLTESVQTNDTDPSPEPFGGHPGIMADLETNSETGIKGDNEDIRRRASAFGLNSSYMEPPPLDDGSFLRLAQKYLKDPTIVLLLCCAFLASVIEIKRDGAVEGLIYGATTVLGIFLFLSLGFLWRYIRLRITTRRVPLTKKKQAAVVRVIRHGDRVSIPESEVVVGEIVNLEAGEKVPADGFLIQCDSSFKLDQRLRPTVNNPSLFAGAKVKTGQGLMLVVSVGDNTERSRLMRSSKNDYNQESRVQISVAKTSSRLERILLRLTFLVLSVELLRCFLSNSDKSCDDTKGVKNTVQDLMHEWTKQLRVKGSGLMFLTVLIFSLRDGLPLGIWVTFGFAKRKIRSSYGAVVRNLPACATIGLTTTICMGVITDDLALNTLEMADLWIGFDWIKDVPVELLTPQVLQLLQDAISTYVSGSDHSHVSNAISDWASRFLGEPNKENEESVVHSHCINGDETELEKFLSSCSHYVNRDGRVDPLDDDRKQSLMKQIASNNGHQVFAFAYNNKQVIQDKDDDNSNDDRDDKVFLASVSLKNLYLRRTIQEFQSSGISIKLAVEADVATARNMVIHSGILRREEDIEEAVIEASDFLNREEEERRKMIRKVHIIANASPADKLKFVQCLKQQGNEVVGFCSSCTRDLPTLKEADVGIFMGDIDVEKDPDIIIISGKNFSTVSNVMRSGRSACESVKLLVQLQLILNITPFFVNFISAMANKEVQVINPFQVLWMNLAMDLLGAPALAIGIIDCTPVTLTLNGEDDPIITRTTWRNVGIQSWFQFAILMTVQLKLGRVLFEKADESVLTTFTNGCYALCQVFSLLTISMLMLKKKKKISVFEGRLLGNRIFLLTLWVVGSIGFLEVGWVEIMALVARCGSLSTNQWLICIGIAAALIPVASLFTV